jgi:flagellar biogenesis protein FliO
VIFSRWKSSSLMVAWVVLAMIAVPVGGSPVSQTTRPAAVVSPTDQATEDQSLRVTESDAKAIRPHAQTPDATTSNAADLLRIVFALGIVIGLILLLRAGLRRMSSLPGAGRNKLVTVLSRSMISPRQQILVLQVGKRLLVVGDSGGSMSHLCELTDPDEIALLIGQSRQSADALSEVKKLSFGSIFRRANEPFDAQEEDAGERNEESADHPPQVPSVEEVGGLLDKIKLLQQQYKLKS